MSTSSLTFDIAQFFPSLNHQLLTLILSKAGFNLKVVQFFLNYLVERKTKYFWNNFSSLFFEVNVGVEQSLCYDLKLELRFHLGKDLRGDKRFIEVVKCKDTG